MKIVAVSDLHGYLPQIQQCDVVCICGDTFPLEVQDDMIKSTAWFYGEFLSWVDQLSCKKVIMIAGNHDFILYNNDYTIARKKLFKRLMSYCETDKLVYLLDESYEFEGKIFYGTPWIPDLSMWAFYGDSKMLQNKFKNIPQKVDVLLTHCPPKLGSTGIVHQWDDRHYMINYGCQELDDTIINKDINWWLCGHVHSGNHTPEIVHGTNIVNVSIKDEDYMVNFNPFEFDI